ncbi:MAG: hypothetical protein AAGD43_16370 [Pseudomonadota bacterium]
MARYEIQGEELCILIPIDAIARNVPDEFYVKDKSKLALSMGRELCECENTGEDYYINDVLDDALMRVVEGDCSSIGIRGEDDKQ